MRNENIEINALKALDYGPSPASLERSGSPFLTQTKQDQRIRQPHRQQNLESRALLLAAWHVRLSACTALRVGAHVRLLLGERRGEVALKLNTFKFRLANLRQSWPFIVWKVGDFASVEMVKFFR